MDENKGVCRYINASSVGFCCLFLNYIYGDNSVLIIGCIPTSLAIQRSLDNESHKSL